MVKLFFIFLFLLSFQLVYSQDSVLYELPENIVEFIENESKDTTQLYHIELSHNNDEIYSLTVHNYYKEDTTKLIINKLINVTNRFVIVKNRSFPLLIDTDFIFAFLGESKTKRKGKKGRLIVLKFSEATVIRFKKNGEIID